MEHVYGSFLGGFYLEVCWCSLSLLAEVSWETSASREVQSLMMLIIVSHWQLLILTIKKISGTISDNKRNRHVLGFFKETLWLEWPKMEKNMRNSFQIKESVAVNEHSIQYCFVHQSSIVHISVDCIKETLSNYSAQWKQNIEE